MLESISAQKISNVSVKVVDARHLTENIEKQSFTHVLNTFMLQTITTPLAAMREMHAVLEPGCVIRIGLWA